MDYRYLGAPVVHSCFIPFFHCFPIAFYRFIAYDPHPLLNPIRNSPLTTVTTHTRTLPQSSRSNGADTSKRSQSHMHVVVHTPSYTLHHCMQKQPLTHACNTDGKLVSPCPVHACVCLCFCVRVCLCVCVIRLYKLGLGLCRCDRLHPNE